jgi:Holliday junction resolvasome RuvABC ATP-dependent DNA helicase subunit
MPDVPYDFPNGGNALLSIESELRAVQAVDRAARKSKVRPASADQRTRNEFRPRTLAGVIGQRPAKELLAAALDAARRTGRPLEHVLFVAASGTGKTTFSHVLASELDVAVYEVEAPVSYDTLLELRETMRDRDILKVEEIHQQGIMERRGRGGGTQPEVLYAIMEDRVMATAEGVLPFPAITVIGTTTDEGRLPDAFVNRFPIRPRLVAYTEGEIVLMAARNARALGMQITRPAARLLSAASRRVPREIGNLVRNCAMLGVDPINSHAARRVLTLNGITEDGLTPDMQAMLTFLLTRARRESKDGEVRYQASVNTIATAIGKSRDSKAIALRVEPYLIEQGLVQVTHGGRQLTDAGVCRAKELIA